MITKLGQVTVETRGCSVGSESDSPMAQTLKIFSDGAGNRATQRDPVVYTHTAADCNL
jgi:hypothetical protein